MGKISILPTLILILTISQEVICNSKPTIKPPAVDPDPNPNFEFENNDWKEFEDFCHAQEINRNTPESISKEVCKKVGQMDFHEDDLHLIFIIFLTLLYGAVIRSILRYFEASLPYTVVIMASGMVVGLAAKFQCYEMYTYTAIARLNAKILLFTFLPLILFESSFSISGHVFIKAVGQVLILAAPGMLFCTFFTASVCFIFFDTYKWTLMQAFFFGCIISATDPVAVVAILKELGVNETLGVLVDGESLLNDGIAILLYEVIQGLILNMEAEGGGHSTGEIVGHVIGDFFRIAIGGPCFGWIMAKVAITCLTHVFNDAVVEITITLVATYLTYYIGEAILGVSGVMAVVLLGITMSSEKTCISPETEHEVHEFWGMVGHLANTVLFFITGVIITERGTRGVGWNDLYYLILLYCALNLIRFFMLLCLSPILSRIGYGLTWQNMIVLMWGGLRGAVGICLSLEVYEDARFCKKPLGPKILIQTAGIVFLTLTVNGTTTKKLLEILKLTEISQGRMDEMKNAVKVIHLAQKKALLMLKHDRFLSDANWTYVTENTRIEDPYKHKQAPSALKKERDTSIVSLGPEFVVNECPECHAHVANQPTNDELRMLTEEARLRVIKAMKISYWAHFERGVLTEEAVQILASTADSCSDRPLYMIHSRDLVKFWQIRGVFPWLREQLIRQVGNEDINQYRYASIPPVPEKKWQRAFWWLATKNWFDILITVIVMINMIPAIWQLIMEAHYDQCTQKWVKSYSRGFFITNIIFTSIYVFEFVVKIFGLGVYCYWQSRWNWLDFSVLVFSLIDVGLSFMDLCAKGSGVKNIFKLVKITRCFRGLKLLRPLVPFIMDFVNGKINTQLFLGYDVALGFIVACDDVLKFLPQMIDNKKVYNKIRINIERERMETVREMGILQKNHPGIAIAIKTRHASRSVLNQMKTMLSELRADGLLDEKENDLLTIVLEERMKRLWYSPSYISPPSPESMLENLIWLYGHPELRDFIFENATLLQYEVGDVIISAGDEPKGIFVVVSGMVRLHYESNPTVKEQREQYGVLPIMEIFKDFDFDKPTEDFFSSGTVIGESSVLTGRKRNASAICETEGVQVYHIPLSAMKIGLETFTDQYNSLEERIWRACGLRRASSFLAVNQLYKTMPKEKLDTLLERSCVPIGPQFEYIHIPPYVQDIVVIEGWVQDDNTGEKYIAPTVIPRSCTNFRAIPNPKTVNRFLVILQEDQNPDDDDDDELARCLLSSKKLRRPSIPTDRKKPGNAPTTEPTGDRQRRPSLAVNFGVRQKSRRQSLASAAITGKRSSIVQGSNTRRRMSVFPPTLGKPSVTIRYYNDKSHASSVLHLDGTQFASVKGRRVVPLVPHCSSITSRGINMNKHKSLPSNNNQREQQSNRSSSSSVRGSTVKPSSSTFMNNNVVPKASTTSSLGSTRPASASSNRSRPSTSQKRPITTPSTVPAKTGLVPPPQKNQATLLGSQSKKPVTNNVKKIYTAPPATTNSAISIRSTGSAKSRSSSVAATSNNPNSSSNNNNSNNKPQDAPSAQGASSNLGSALATTQLHLNTPKTPIKLPFPTPISQQQKNFQSFNTRSSVLLEKSRNFRTFVEKAINEHKIFSCCGVYNSIKNALRKRGWVEKPGPLAYSRSTNAALYHNTRHNDDESDTAWMTRVLKDYPPDFIWVIRRDNIDWKNLTHFQTVNRFPKAWFTTKTGLAACLQHMHWFSEAGVSDTFFPRCYRLCLEEERQAFQDDYRLTACMSYLRYFVNTFETKGTAALADVHSKITPLSIDFACRQLGNYMRMRRHEDIDWLLPPNFMTQHWDAFIHQYYAVVHEKKKLRFDRPEAVRAKYDAAKKMLVKVIPYWPQYQLDGWGNMWICKPGARSRGNGIVIKNNLEKIMDLMNLQNFRECNWVVQKYIERPMLIYKTKFDIRQWFLVTDWTPLTVWFYKESYIRFCTKPFVLEDFHESIHLCNNAIQARYQNASTRDANLPEENMWSNETFHNYLKSLKRPDAWSLIYSGMKQAIVGVLLSSQETIESRKGCYELYGADFMLTDDYKPWLIEINSCPCMAPTTSVTTRMCSQCLEDTIKVVVDRKHNRNADTGKFELIYRQNAGSIAGHEFNGNEITVVGKRLTRDVDWPMPLSKTVVKSRNPSQGIIGIGSNNNSTVPSGLVKCKETLSEVLQKLRVRNQEMYQGVQQPKVGVIIEKVSASQETGTLLDKMLSFKTTESQEKDKISSKSVGGILRSNPGKGEDPSPIPSKFMEMNESLAFLLKNSQNNFINDLIKVSRDTAQELLSRSKALQETKKKETKDEKSTTKNQPPKTLAEAKAMVESSLTGRSLLHGSRPHTPRQQNSEKCEASGFAQGSCNSKVSSENQEIMMDSAVSSVGILCPSSNDSGSLSDRVLLSKSESTLNISSNSTTRITFDDNVSTVATSNSVSIFRRTKSLSFAGATQPRTWLSERDFDFLKSRASEHKVYSTKSQKSLVLCTAPSYMIYPEPAHGSHDLLICDEDCDRHYTDGTNTTTPSEVDVADQDSGHSLDNLRCVRSQSQNSELSRIEELVENDDALDVADELKEEIICRVEDDQVNKVARGVSQNSNTVVIQENQTDEEKINDLGNIEDMHIMDEDIFESGVSDMSTDELDEEIEFLDDLESQLIQEDKDILFPHEIRKEDGTKAETNEAEKRRLLASKEHGTTQEKVVHGNSGSLVTPILKQLHSNHSLKPVQDEIEIENLNNVETSPPNLNNHTSNNNNNHEEREEEGQKPTQTEEPLLIDLSSDTILEAQRLSAQENEANGENEDGNDPNVLFGVLYLFLMM